MRTLDPRPRLAMEAAAASLAFFTGARVHLVNGPVDWLLTVVWLVVLTNSFNLLDNMDGAAAVVATTTAVALTVAAVVGGQVLVGGLAAIVAGSCLGFLLYNWHPARIFMGDAGSLFLGFLLAALALKLRFSVGHLSAAVAVVFLAGPALFDTTLVVLSRSRARRPIYLGGTDHTSHRLLGLGLSTHGVGMVLLAVTAVCGGLGVAVGHGVVTPWVALPLASTGVVLLAALLRQERSGEVEHVPLAIGEPIAVLADIE
jgi:UDP-GlcNAc:undecaprenyl-phosphate GlcNAc-1-phosphate transferase